MKKRKPAPKILTYRSMEFFSARIPWRDLDALRKAATIEEISVSEFFRRAVHERASRIIAGGRSENCAA
jgi:hypothetical protein